MTDGRRYGVLEYLNPKTKETSEMRIPISPREGRLQHSLIVQKILCYTEQLVVCVQADPSTDKYSFMVFRAIPESAFKLYFEELLITQYFFPSYEEASLSLEKTLRLITGRFYDEHAGDERFAGDGFVMLNDAIVDCIMCTIGKRKVSWVNECI